MKFIYLLLLLLFIIGCSQVPRIDDRPLFEKKINVGEPFQLHIGDSVILDEANITITLQDAINYRCPEDVVCDSGGNFNAGVLLENLDTGETKKVGFFADTDAHFDYTLFGGYVIHPVEWKPEKVWAGRSIANSSYEITFIVERGIAFDQQFIMGFGDAVPLDDGNILLSLENITFRQHEDRKSKGEFLLQATLHFKIKKGAQEYTGEIKYGDINYTGSQEESVVHLGEYQVFLKELIGKQPYYHSFGSMKEEVTNPTQYQAQMWVART